MNVKNESLNCDISFPITELYDKKFYSTTLPDLGNVQFTLVFFIRENNLVIQIERNTQDLAAYSIKISNCQSHPNITKSQIRFDNGQQENKIVLKDAFEYIIGPSYNINIQIAPKKFNVPKYENKYKRENHKKQSNINDFFTKTTEDYLGLPNQGATCYLNSLLQVLYHLKKFRKFIYEKNVEQNEANFIFCLQLLFRDLQLRKSRRSTKHLTNALKWNKEEISTSQDVSEFYKFFFESILNGEKATSLFEGMFDITITNFNNGNQRHMKEMFIQIMLKVDGFSNIIDSFKMFFSPFSFYDNKGKDGTEESIKQFSISKFPPVLSIVLKRYRFNDEKSEFEKLNSIIVFPKMLNFSEFDTKYTDSEYQLYAIIAHVGTMNSGHYVSFVNPDLKGNWYEFDDNKVFKRSEEVTFDLCYGKNRFGAYMLFYIKLNMKDEIFTKSLNIPQSIEKYKYIVVKEPPSQYFMNNEEGIIKNLRKLKTSFLNIEVRKSLSFEIGTSFNEIYKKVASLWNKKSNLIRIWNVKNDSLIGVFNYKEKLKKLDNHCWFVQEISSESEEITILENHFIAFISFFLPKTPQKLFYLGSHQFSIYDEISRVEKVVCEKYLLNHFTLFLFAFIKDQIIPITNTSLKFIDLSLIFNGIFFIVQSQPDENISFENFSINFSNQIEVDERNECKIEYNDIKETDIDFFDSYVKYQFNKVVIYLFHFIDLEKPFLKLTLQKGSSSMHLKRLIAINSSIDYDEKEDTILLFNKSNLNQFLDEESLNYILQKGNNTNNICFLIYKGIKEIHQFNQMKIKVSYNNNNKQITFFIVRNEPKKIIQKNLIDNNIIPDEKKLRFYLVYQSRITLILDDSDTIPDEKTVLHIEKIPNYQMDDDIYILRVNQAIKDADELVCFGDPFIIGIKFNELCAQTKERICSLIGCNIKDLNILIQSNLGQDNSYRLLMDTENIFDCLDGNNEIFALVS